jgi:hypothetical protein
LLFWNCKGGLERSPFLMYFNTAPAAMQHVNFQREMGNYMQMWVRVVQEVEKAAENQIIEIIVGQQG